MESVLYAVCQLILLKKEILSILLLVSTNSSGLLMKAAMYIIAALFGSMIAARKGNKMLESYDGKLSRTVL